LPVGSGVGVELAVLLLAVVGVLAAFLAGSHFGHHVGLASGIVVAGALAIFALFFSTLSPSGKLLVLGVEALVTVGAVALMWRGMRSISELPPEMSVGQPQLGQSARWLGSTSSENPELGRVQYRGTTWPAECLTGSPSRDASVEIVRVDGFKLIVCVPGAPISLFPHDPGTTGADPRRDPAVKAGEMAGTDQDDVPYPVSEPSRWPSTQGDLPR
jgi:membrane protein implicated in regulation of membrane protease activity